MSGFENKFCCFFITSSFILVDQKKFKKCLVVKNSYHIHMQYVPQQKRKIGIYQASKCPARKINQFKEFF